MSLPDVNTVRSVLKKNGRDALVRSCIEKAWEDLITKYPQRAAWRRKSTTRALMWENSIEAVVAALDADPGIKPISHTDTVSFIADDTVLFRLKKATSGLFSSNYPTPLAGLFHKHDVDLFGHEGFHRVEVVHVFNRFQSAIDWIGVVARDKGRVLWQFELPRVAGAVVVDLPVVAPTQPAAATVLQPAVLPEEKKADEGDK